VGYQNTEWRIENRFRKWDYVGMIKSFFDLEIYQDGLALAKEIH